jgi:hypothetical protein
LALASLLLLASCSQSSEPASGTDASADGIVEATGPDAVVDAGADRSVSSACGDAGSPCCAGQTCGVGAVCVAGTCQPAYVQCLIDSDCNDDSGPPLFACKAGWCKCATTCVDSGDCVDTANDPLNCGGCGNACSPNETCQAGQCGCPLTTCPAGAGTVCVDLSTDNANCGACGTLCDYQCAAGQCGPRVIAIGKQGLIALDTSTQSLVVNASLPSQGFYTCATPHCAGGAKLTGTTPDTIGWMGASNGNLFYDDTSQGQNTGSGQLFVCPENDCTTPMLLPGGTAQPNPFNSGVLAVTATSAFWIDWAPSGFNATNIWTCATSGTCTPTKVGAGTIPLSIAVDGNDLYWAENTGDIWVSDLTGKNPTLLVPAAQAITSDSNSDQIVLAVGGQVYWITGYSNRLMTAGRTVPATPFASCGPCGGVSTDGTYIYFSPAFAYAANDRVGTHMADVGKCPIGTLCTNPTVVIPNSGLLLGPNVVVDDKNVYWTVDDNLMVFHK